MILMESDFLAFSDFDKIMLPLSISASSEISMTSSKTKAKRSLYKKMMLFIRFPHRILKGDKYKKYFYIFKLKR